MESNLYSRGKPPSSGLVGDPASPPGPVTTQDDSQEDRLCLTTNQSVAARPIPTDCSRKLPTIPSPPGSTARKPGKRPATVWLMPSAVASWHLGTRHVPS